MQHWKDNFHQTRQKTEYYEKDLDGEEWVPYKNYYVSNKGRVRHSKKNNLLRPSIACGYYKVRLSYDGLVEDKMIHHLVYSLFAGEYDKDKFIVDHIDGNKLNNDINNLRLLTKSENVMAALYKTRTNSFPVLISSSVNFGNRFIFIDIFPMVLSDVLW